MPDAVTFPTGSIRCPKCSMALLADSWGGGVQLRCPSCESRLEAHTFSALTAPASTGAGGNDRAGEGEAACFFHPAKKASLCCERCGRFICTLCDMPLGSRHLCPSCLGSGIGTDKVLELVSRRVCWSRVSLWIGGPPLFVSPIIWPLMFVAGPAAIVTALIGWNKPGSVVRGRQRWAALLGILLGLLEIAAGLAMFALVTNRFPHA